MRLPLNPIFWACSALLLSACASNGVPTEVRYDPDKSEALNVTEMAGLEGLKDIPAQQWNSDDPVGDTLDASYAVSNIFTPAPGFDLAGGLAFSALFILANNEPEHPATYNHLWLWLPEEMVKSTEHGNELAKKLVYDAVLSSFDPKKKLVEKTRVFKPLLAGNSEYKTLVEPGCPEFHDTHNDAYELDCSGDLTPKISYYYQDALDHVAPAPTFTNISGNARGPVEVAFHATGIFRDQIWKKRDRNFWQKVSTKLPSWAFIYVAPDERKSLPPVVLNKGEALMFVRPKETASSSS